LNICKTVKDLFMLYFVSVGMMIDPEMLVKYAIPVGILTFVVIVGQSVPSTVGTLLSGQPLKQSVNGNEFIADWRILYYCYLRNYSESN
jgi:CPA2 family monovalent cation:H+ antiporter-2